MAFMLDIPILKPVKLPGPRAQTSASISEADMSLIAQEGADMRHEPFTVLQLIFYASQLDSLPRLKGKLEISRAAVHYKQVTIWHDLFPECALNRQRY